ncbi:MAG: NUDIX hydrolase [Parcubacteria group bacterium]|nr:NUDIX hydrolase [Parcubacteria group bacterium]
MKIPTHAKKVFSGEIFDVYQWPQKMFDGSTQTYEALKRTDTVQVIPVMGDKLMISLERQPHTGDFYTLLGGRREKGESVEEAAFRELAEESGLAPETLKLFRIYEPGSKVDWKVYVYLAFGCKKVAEPILDAGEKIQLRMLSLDELMDLCLSDTFRCADFAFDLCKRKLHDTSLSELKKTIFGDYHEKKI